MGSAAPWLATFDQAFEMEESLVGGKACGLVRLRRSGFRIAGGFCLTTAAYRHYVEQNALERVIAFELGRKSLESMRWEELWDAALRIRSAFMKAPIPADLTAAIRVSHRAFGQEKNLAVRSSAPGEDSAHASFAGVHESVLDVQGCDALLDAVRIVWASLWSDAALLYRRELALDPRTSSMAVLVQELVEGEVSGVAFSRDPADPAADHLIIEAVPGRCSQLVDGLVDPDRWTLERSTGEIVSSQAGRRELIERADTLLQESDLRSIRDVLLRIDSLAGDAVDLEWTLDNAELGILQARPISAIAKDHDQTRLWYLSLRPAAKRLKELAHRVSDTLIPALEALGHRFAAEDIASKTDTALADALTQRLEAVQHWRKVYWDEFIPFAHGVRQLALYYNDRVRPEDPYEFVGLLRGESLLALQRNQRLEALANLLAQNPQLSQALRPAAARSLEDEELRSILAHARTLPGGKRFAAGLEKLLEETLDVAYGEQRLAAHPQYLLAHLFEMTRGTRQRAARIESPSPAPTELEQRLFAAVGAEHRAEAEEVLAIGRLSWRLRDDDNILLARLEAQLLAALNLAARRLAESGRLEAPCDAVKEQDTRVIAAALRDLECDPILLSPSKQGKTSKPDEARAGKPRQLVGQPAAPGIGTGLVRIIDAAHDLRHFRAGEVLVCRAIEPTMTHLVPLARAIVETRGGMLIHGAIIARELGIPCVNGIPEVAALLHNGDLVTVDGHLGIVTVGAPEFDLEGVTLDGSTESAPPLKRV